MYRLLWMLLVAPSALSQTPSSSPRPSAPVVVSIAEPSFGTCPAKRGSSFNVRVSLIVTAEGNPSSLALVDPGVDPCLEAQALKAVALYRFRPATREGLPIPVKMTIEVNFSKF